MVVQVVNVPTDPLSSRSGLRAVVSKSFPVPTEEPEEVLQGVLRRVLQGAFQRVLQGALQGPASDGHRARMSREALEMGVATGALDTLVAKVPYDLVIVALDILVAVALDMRVVIVAPSTTVAMIATGTVVAM